MVSSPQQYREGRQEEARPGPPAAALAVSPHPDDAEVGAGGTLARWAAEGCRVVLAVCTNGDKGSEDPNMTSAELARLRREEQLAAAKVLGIEDVVFLDHPDGFLEDDARFRGELVRLVRQHRPEVVLSTDPERRYMQHRDHRMAGQVALDACFPYARDRLHFPEHEKEGLQPHKVGAILFWGTEEPQEFVDISDTIELKVQSLAKHASQMNGRNPAEFVMRNAKAMGERAGLPCAEGFRKVEFRR